MRKPKKPARSVLDLIEQRMTRASIKRSDAKARRMLLALRLAEFRRAMRKDQGEVKGFSQPAVSKIEGRGDLRLSTLVEYCKGLDADVRIIARPSKRGRGKEFVLLDA